MTCFDIFFLFLKDCKGDLAFPEMIYLMSFTKSNPIPHNLWESLLI